MNSDSNADSRSPRIVSSTISLGLVSIFTMVLGLIGTIIITRHFSVEEFGAYTLVLVFSSFLSQISTFGLELGTPKFIASSKDKLTKEQFFNTSVFIRFFTIVLTAFIAWYGEPFLKLLFGQSLLPDFILYVPLLFTVESLRGLLRATLQGNLLFSKIGVADSMVSAINFLGIIFVYITKGDIATLILVRVFSAFLANVFSFISIPIRKRISINLDAFKKLIKFGYPLQINDILGFIYSRVDTISIAVFLGPVDIATYEVARKIPDYLRNLYEPFKSVYYPFVSKQYDLDGQEKAGKFLNESIRFVAFVTLLGAVIAILFGREILQFAFTEKYSSSAPVFAILMFNLSIGLISNVMGTTLVAVGDTQKPPLINFFNAVASWLGSILLIPVFALIGASIANTLGTAVAFPLNRSFLRKKIGLDDMTYLKPIIVFIVWAIIVLFVRPELIIEKIALLIAFLIACIFFSVINKRDLILLIDSSGISSWPLFNKLSAWVCRL